MRTWNLCFLGVLLVLSALWSVRISEPGLLDESDVYELDGIRLGMTEAEVRKRWGRLRKDYAFTGEPRLWKPGSSPIMGNHCTLDAQGRLVSVSGRHLRRAGRLVLSTSHPNREYKEFGEKLATLGSNTLVATQCFKE